jgi:hypothetical protein
MEGFAAGDTKFSWWGRRDPSFFSFVTSPSKARNKTPRNDRERPDLSCYHEEQVVGLGQAAHCASEPLRHPPKVLGLREHDQKTLEHARSSTDRDTIRTTWRGSEFGISVPLESSCHHVSRSSHIAASRSLIAWACSTSVAFPSRRVNFCSHNSFAREPYIGLIYSHYCIPLYFLMVLLERCFLS